MKTENVGVEGAVWWLQLDALRCPPVYLHGRIQPYIDMHCKYISRRPRMAIVKLEALLDYLADFEHPSKAPPLP